MNKPLPEEYSPFYANYINKADENIFEELERQQLEVPNFLRSIPEEKADYSYQEGKWTIKQLIGHLVDTERVMAYRLLRFSRFDATPLPGFDENLFVENSDFLVRSLESLIEEFEMVRKSNIYLFHSLSEQQLTFSANSNGNNLSVKALLFIMSGHVKHHMDILRDRYLKQ